MIQSALIRQITPPNAIAKPIKEREIAIRLRENDVIVFFGETAVAGVDELHRLLTEDRIGQPTPLTVIREREVFRVVVIPWSS